MCFGVFLGDLKLIHGYLWAIFRCLLEKDTHDVCHTKSSLVFIVVVSLFIHTGRCSCQVPLVGTVGSDGRRYPPVLLVTGGSSCFWVRVTWFFCLGPKGREVTLIKPQEIISHSGRNKDPGRTWVKKTYSRDSKIWKTHPHSLVVLWTLFLVSSRHLSLTSGTLTLVCVLSEGVVHREGSNVSREETWTYCTWFPLDSKEYLT